ncbi:MAG: hypothetical protein IRY86_11160, partial [Thermorudis peleae]|nr:hypothetical protein [Thermorudis peleae]
RQIAELRETVTELRETVAEHSRQIAELRQTVADHSRQLAELRETITELRETVAEHSRQIAELRETVVEHSRQIAELRSTVADHSRQIAELRETVAEHSRQIAELRETVAEHSRQIAELREAVTELRETVAEHSRQIAELRETVAEQSRQISELRQAIEDNTAQLRVTTHRTDAVYGLVLELQAQQRLSSWLGRVLTRLQVRPPGEWADYLRPVIGEDAFDVLLDADLLGRARLRDRPDVEVWLVIEVSGVVNTNDIDRVVAWASHLRASLPRVVPIVVGTRKAESAAERARAAGVAMLEDGTLVGWPEALASWAA